MLCVGPWASPWVGKHDTWCALGLEHDQFSQVSGWVRYMSGTRAGA